MTTPSMTTTTTTEPLALVVVDMQRAFLDASVGFRFAPAALDVVEPVNALARRVRAAGLPVVWVLTTSRPGTEDWPSLRRLLGDEAMDHRTGVLEEGSYGHALWPQMDVAPQDVVVRKYRYSAMAEPGGELEGFLRARGIRRVAVVGTQTDVCCDATARDAMMAGIDVVLVEDCLAAETPERHEAALVSLAAAFAEVVTSDELGEQLARSATPGAGR